MSTTTMKRALCLSLVLLLAGAAAERVRADDDGLSPETRKDRDAWVAGNDTFADTLNTAPDHGAVATALRSLAGSWRSDHAAHPRILALLVQLHEKHPEDKVPLFLVAAHDDERCQRAALAVVTAAFDKDLALAKKDPEVLGALLAVVSSRHMGPAALAVKLLEKAAGEPADSEPARWAASVVKKLGLTSEELRPLLVAIDVQRSIAGGNELLAGIATAKDVAAIESCTFGVHAILRNLRARESDEELRTALALELRLGEARTKRKAELRIEEIRGLTVVEAVACDPRPEGRSRAIVRFGRDDRGKGTSRIYSEQDPLQDGTGQPLAGSVTIKKIEKTGVTLDVDGEPLVVLLETP